MPVTLQVILPEVSSKGQYLHFLLRHLCLTVFLCTAMRFGVEVVLVTAELVWLLKSEVEALATGCGSVSSLL